MEPTQKAGGGGTVGVAVNASAVAGPRGLDVCIGGATISCPIFVQLSVGGANPNTS